MCWSHAQSPLPVVTPPEVRKRSKGSFSKSVLVEVLVPHGIGDYDVVAGNAARGVLELGVDYRVAALDAHVHVVDDCVHVGDGVAVGLQLLAVEFEGNTAGGVGLAGDQLELDEQPGGATGKVVAGLAGPGPHYVGHQEADLGGGEELARTLAGALRELAQQVLVGAAQKVRLHVGEAEPVARVGEGLDDGSEAGRVEVALAVALGGEVHEVYDAGERRIPPHDGTHCHGQVLADVAGPRAAALGVRRPFVGLPTADDVPAGLRGQVEAHQLVVALRDFLCDGAVPELLGQPLYLVVEHVRETLEEEEGQQVVLELGGVLFASDGAGGVPQHLLHGLGVGNGRLALGGTAAWSRRAADSAWSTAGSPSVDAPASTASAAIAVRAALCGVVTPPSHRFTVANDTPRRSASCSCVRSSLARMACRVGGIVCWYVISVMVKR